MFTYKTPSEKTILYLHIPKTAGTSFDYIVKHFFAPQEICPAHFWHELLTLPSDKLQEYRYFGGHFHHNVQDLIPHKELLKLTFLRDPVERVLSHYSHVLRSAKTPLPKHSSIEEFLDDPATHGATKDLQTRYLSWNIDYINWKKEFSQFSFTFDMPRGTSDEALLEIAKKRLARFDFVGITERFEDSLVLLSPLLGWPRLKTHERRNTSPNRLQPKDLSPKTLDKIIELNHLDIQLYEFGVKLFEERFSKIATTTQTLEQSVQAHYEDNFKKTYPPSDNLVFDFSRVFPGSGWHHAETHPVHGTYRWSGPETTAYLDLPLSSEKDLTIIIKVIGGISPEVLHSLCIAINGVSVPVEARPGDNYSAYYEGVISKDILQKSGSSISRLTLSVDQTIAPSSLDTDSSDTRLLGIAVCSIELF